MKLIGAGLPRTATLTQRVAIEMLGLEPCHHMQSVFANWGEVDRWRAVLDGELAPWEIVGEYPAAVDWPTSFYYRELMERYPDAKVLLSVRDGDAWARSMQQTIWALFYSDTLMRHLSDARTQVDPTYATYIMMMKEMWERSGLMHGPDTTLEFMSTAMQRYNDEVKQTVSADRLLVWSPADGWEPLCELLEVPVPDAPFPHVNESGQFVEQFVQISMLKLNEALGERVAVAG
jgi:Sulfotransferase domain